MTPQLPTSWISCTQSFIRVPYHTLLIPRHLQGLSSSNKQQFSRQNWRVYSALFLLFGGHSRPNKGLLPKSS
ncbi:hypothetical protein WJX77_000513 [Trebouxia sp. C0004]